MKSIVQIEDVSPLRRTTAAEDKIIARALKILERRMLRDTFQMSSPATVKQYLVMKMARLEYEVFCVLWLDVKNRVIACDDMFRGSISHCSVHPREVLRSAISYNAASCLLTHVHPTSGNPEPSDADRYLTKALRDALSLIDVRVLDHIIVADTQTYSFAEHGLI